MISPVTAGPSNHVARVANTCISTTHTYTETAGGKSKLARVQSKSRIPVYSQGNGYGQPRPNTVSPHTVKGKHGWLADVITVPDFKPSSFISQHPLSLVLHCRPPPTGAIPTAYQNGATYVLYRSHLRPFTASVRILISPPSTRSDLSRVQDSASTSQGVIKRTHLESLDRCAGSCGEARAVLALLALQSLFTVNPLLSFFRTHYDCTDSALKPPLPPPTFFSGNLWRNRARPFSRTLIA